MAQVQGERFVGEQPDGRNASELAASGQVAKHAAASSHLGGTVVVRVARASPAAPRDHGARDASGVARVDAHGVQVDAKSGFQRLGVGGGIEEQDAPASVDEAAKVSRPGRTEGEVESFVGEENKRDLRGVSRLTESRQPGAKTSQASEASEGARSGVGAQRKACGSLHQRRLEQALHVEVFEPLERSGEGFRFEARGREELSQRSLVRASLERLKQGLHQRPERFAYVRQERLLFALPGSGD